MEKRTKNIAVVAAKGLGDGLLSSILSHNLTLSGHQVTTFNTLLSQLQRWFPKLKCAPFPQADQVQSTFEAFDEVLASDYTIVKERDNFGNLLRVFKQDLLDKNKSYVENLAYICREHLKLDFYGHDNGIAAPKELTFQKYRRRVVIHAMSADPIKIWPKEKFIKLALRLHSLGFSPAIVVSEQERIAWSDLENHAKITLPRFQNLDEVACFIYESGFLIGNDSGLGHLASNLNIPTLSIFARMSHARLWKPGWGQNSVVTPLPILLGAPMKQRYWKLALPVNRVLKHFKSLTNAFVG